MTPNKNVSIQFDDNKTSGDFTIYGDGSEFPKQGDFKILEESKNNYTILTQLTGVDNPNLQWKPFSVDDSKTMQENLENYLNEIYFYI